MEYIAKCSKCGKHNVIDSKRRIKAKSAPVQRFGRCVTCKKRKRQIIVGEVIKRFVRWSSFRIRWWK